MSKSASDKYAKHERNYRHCLAEAQRIEIRKGYRHPDTAKARAKADRNFRAMHAILNVPFHGAPEIKSFERPTVEEIRMAELMARL